MAIVRILLVEDDEVMSSSLTSFDGGLVTVGIGIRGRATERLSPVSGESLNMVGVEAVAERMGDHFVGHHPAVRGVGKTAQAGDATRCLEDSLHASMMTWGKCEPGVPVAIRVSQGNPRYSPTSPDQAGAGIVKSATAKRHIATDGSTYYRGRSKYGGFYQD